jgi:diacylglycerol kinase (ATP)
MNSFKYAFRGIAETLAHERNMRVHLCFAYYVLLAGFVTRISVAEWAAVLICIGLVTALECLNTALEALCDTIHPEHSQGIRRAKDAAAGAVLCAALASAVVGGCVFFRAERVDLALAFCQEHIVAALIIILMLIPLAFFVRGRKRVKK